MKSRQAISSSIPVMSTTVTILSVDIGDMEHNVSMQIVRDTLAVWDQRFSRFRTDSLLRQLNAANGQWVKVDESFTQVLTLAKRAVFETTGRFDPAILPALEAVGYITSIENLRTGIDMMPTPATYLHGVEAWDMVDIDPETHRIRLPTGMRIDLGGIAKGALADHLAERFAHWHGGAISIGGDMRIWGVPPEGPHWRVGIEDPDADATDLASVELTNPSWRAIATSSTAKRQWRTSQGTAHHLIDPIQNVPAVIDVIAVTACASTTTEAEITTKNMMIQSTSRRPDVDTLLGSAWALLVSRSHDLTLISREGF